MKRLNLKAERMKKGFSAEYMASLLDVSCSAYYKYEGGKNNIPLNKAQQMSIILDCSLDTLFPVSEISQKEGE